jgi:hypothetical protein
VIPFALARAAGRVPAGLAPSVEFTATSRRLDLAELTAGRDEVGYVDLVKARLAGRAIDGRDPAELARGRYTLPPLPPVEARGRVEIAELLNPPTRAENVAFDIIVTEDGVLEVKALEAAVYRGALTGSLTLDLRRGPPFPLRYAFALRGAEAGGFLERWTRLGRALTGKVDFEVKGSAALDETLLPTPDALDADGKTVFREGRFQELPLARALARALKLKPDRLAAFDELGGAFRIEGAAFVLGDWDLRWKDLTGRVGGSAGLGGALDLRLALAVPPAVLREAGLVTGGGRVLGELLGGLTEDDRPIPLAVAVGGTIASPVVRVDTEALKQELARRLKGKGRDLLKRLWKPPPR